MSTTTEATTAAAPTDGPVRVQLQQIKTTRTYTVTGVPTLMDSHRALFLPERVEVNLRNGEATTVVVTGPHIRTGRTRSACFSVGRWPEPVPAWVAELVRDASFPDREVDDVMDLVERFARDYVDMPHPDAAREEIRDALLDLASQG